MPPYIHNCDEAQGPWTVSKRCSLCVPARKDAGKKPGKSAAITHRLRRVTNKLKRLKPSPSHSVCSECGDQGRATVTLAEPDWNPEPEQGPDAATNRQRPGDAIGPMNETPADFVFKPRFSEYDPCWEEEPTGVDDWLWASGSGESYNTRFPPPSLGKILFTRFCCPCVVRLAAPKPMTESERLKRDEETWDRIQRARRRSRPWIRRSDWNALQAIEE
ncbi:hypothetical protein CSAL01_02579 [Colletotrichum salicis]|uniref:Uncharacterized protein n=1 Tax=Colletotrichum salicis TaxID=1209931 RepID=A0A135V4E8_9PEZI|nr:hypothetical protein CSAL01_02579 [Colletotrichum salicis]